MSKIPDKPPTPQNTKNRLAATIDETTKGGVAEMQRREAIKARGEVINTLLKELGIDARNFKDFYESIAIVFNRENLHKKIATATLKKLIEKYNGYLNSEDRERQNKKIYPILAVLMLLEDETIRPTLKQLLNKRINKQKLDEAQSEEVIKTEEIIVKFKDFIIDLLFYDSCGIFTNKKLDEDIRKKYADQILNNLQEILGSDLLVNIIRHPNQKTKDKARNTLKVALDFPQTKLTTKNLSLALQFFSIRVGAGSDGTPNPYSENFNRLTETSILSCCKEEIEFFSENFATSNLAFQILNYWYGQTKSLIYLLSCFEPKKDFDLATAMQNKISEISFNSKNFESLVAIPLESGINRLKHNLNILANSFARIDETVEVKNSALDEIQKDFIKVITILSAILRFNLKKFNKPSTDSKQSDEVDYSQLRHTLPPSGKIANKNGPITLPLKVRPSIEQIKDLITSKPDQFLKDMEPILAALNTQTEIIYEDDKEFRPSHVPKPVRDLHMLLTELLRLDSPETLSPLFLPKITEILNNEINGEPIKRAKDLEELLKLFAAVVNPKAPTSHISVLARRIKDILSRENYYVANIDFIKLKQFMDGFKDIFLETSIIERPQSTSDFTIDL